MIESNSSRNQASSAQTISMKESRRTAAGWECRAITVNASQA
jgi:hypothetical protein